jgi:hypothetical protein
LLGSQFNELPWPKKINFLPKMSTPIVICCKLSPKKNSCIHTLQNKVDVPIDVHQVIWSFPPCYLVGLLWPSMCCPIASHIYPICFAQMYACLAYIMGPIYNIIPYVLPKKVCMSFLHNGAKYTANFLAWPHKLKVYYFW